jgi:hypothetical protein
MVTVKSQGASVNITHVDNPAYAVGDVPLVVSPDTSYGDDINIPLLVCEAGERQIKRMKDRRVQLETELEKINKNLQTLEQLIAVARSN